MSAIKEIDVEIWKRNLRGAPLDDDNAYTRWFNNYFAFWLVCQTRACKRGKRCALVGRRQKAREIAVAIGVAQRREADV